MRHLHVYSAVDSVAQFLRTVEESRVLRKDSWNSFCAFLDDVLKYMTNVASSRVTELR